MQPYERRRDLQSPATMDQDRIAALLAPFAAPGELSSSDNLLRSISIYIDILLRWNARINLTSIRDPEQIIIRHFGESLFTARYLFPTHTAKWIEEAKNAPRLSLADLGSGAGFPGIPIKLVIPKLALTLIESNQKKSVFLREVLRTLELTDARVENARAETLSETWDVVTLRAVERLREVLPAAARLVAPQGRLMLLIGRSQIESACSALREFIWSPAVPIPLSDSRVLLVGGRNQVD